MEITAAGIDDENVKPTFSPRYTLEAVKMTVISIPRNIPLKVNSGRDGYTVCSVFETI
jgi:hypothetical protein